MVARQKCWQEIRLCMLSAGHGQNVTNQFFLSFRSILAGFIPVLHLVTYALLWYKSGQKISLRISSLHPPPHRTVIKFRQSLLFLMKHIHGNKCKYKLQRSMHEIHLINANHQASQHRLIKANMLQIVLNFLHHFQNDYNKKGICQKRKKAPPIL